MTRRRQLSIAARRRESSPSAGCPEGLSIVRRTANAPAADGISGVSPAFASAKARAGMYESFYLRTVSGGDPIGAWIRYTVQKRPSQAPSGSLWITVFDAIRGAPFMHRDTTTELSAPEDCWIAIGQSHIGPSLAEGECGPARWRLSFQSEERELRHLRQSWLYAGPLPRTKLTSPSPDASFAGAIELPDRTLEVKGWRGMVGHNWGTEHAERWIWLHGIDFAEDPSAWIDVALARVRVGGRLTPWLAAGAISLGGQRLRLGGLGARGVRAEHSAAGCALALRGEDGVAVQARARVPAGAAAGWRYSDPGSRGEGSAGEHDVVNCSVAEVSLEVSLRDRPERRLHTDHGGAYELGMRERDHGVPNHGLPLAPFLD